MGRADDHRLVAHDLLTLERGLRILSLLAESSSSRGVDHATLARRTGFTRSTLYRYLACLEQEGFIERSDTPGRYRLGRTVVYFAAVVHTREFANRARDHVTALAQATGETAYATIYSYPYSVAILVVDGEGPIGPRVPIGSRRPLHASASGKLYLAYESSVVTAAYLSRPLEALTDQTITTRQALEATMAEARANGYAVDQGESFEGICGVAAPVFDFSGHVIGTLSFVVACQRLEQHEIDALSKPLLENARDLSTQLGYEAAARQPRRRTARPVAGKRPSTSAGRTRS